MRQRHIGVRSLALGVALASLAGVPAIASQQGPTAQAPDEARPGPIARAVGALFRPATPHLRADGTAPFEPATDAKPTGSGVPARRQDQSGQVTSGNAFNPAISLIPDLAYYRDSRAGEGIGLLGRADGFGRGDNQGQSSTGGLSPGFNLRELEIALSGTVDPYFDAVANLSVAEGAIEAEELYLRTRRFPAGLQLKAGRFLSDIGYINRQHPHQWALADQNLAYDLLLDGSLGDTGVQVTWLPALPIYLQVGAEALQGDNAAMAAHVGPDADHPHFSEMAGPRVLTGFAKVSPNLGYDHALQVGTSVVRARQHQEETSDGALEGQAWLFGLDAVYKFDSPKPSGAGDSRRAGRVPSPPEEPDGRGRRDSGGFWARPGPSRRTVSTCRRPTASVRAGRPRSGSTPRG